MSISSTTIQPVNTPTDNTVVSHDATAASLLTMAVLSVYAAQKSKKSMRRMKRRFLWTALKLKMKSAFSKKRVSDRVLIYILLGIIALVLVFYYPLIALLVAVIALILILAGVI